MIPVEYITLVNGEENQIAITFVHALPSEGDLIMLREEHEVPSEANDGAVMTETRTRYFGIMKRQFFIDSLSPIRILVKEVTANDMAEASLQSRGIATKPH